MAHELRVYLGVHQPSWLAHLEVPLFLSDRHLGDRARLPGALGRRALDSGGFKNSTCTAGGSSPLVRYLN